MGHAAVDAEIVPGHVRDAVGGRLAHPVPPVIYDGLRHMAGIVQKDLRIPHLYHDGREQYGRVLAVPATQIEGLHRERQPVLRPVCVHILGVPYGGTDEGQYGAYDLHVRPAVGDPVQIVLHAHDVWIPGLRIDPLYRIPGQPRPDGRAGLGCAEVVGVHIEDQRPLPVIGVRPDHIGVMHMVPDVRVCRLLRRPRLCEYDQDRIGHDHGQGDVSETPPEPHGAFLRRLIATAAYGTVNREARTMMNTACSVRV